MEPCDGGNPPLISELSAGALGPVLPVLPLLLAVGGTIAPIGNPPLPRFPASGNAGVLTSELSGGATLDA